MLQARKVLLCGSYIVSYSIKHTISEVKENGRKVRSIIIFSSFCLMTMKPPLVCVLCYARQYGNVPSLFRATIIIGRMRS